LRASPASAFDLASALQVFIFSCWVCGAAVAAGAAAVEPPLRQVFMKALRSAPASALVFASALQSFIFCCCAVSGLAVLAASCANAADEPNASATARANENVVFSCMICFLSE
jgi:hypothetical protein